MRGALALPALKAGVSRAKLMKKNILTINLGNFDRALRILAGLMLLSLVVIGPQTLWGLIGLIPLATGLFSWCPVYSLLGLNSCGSTPKD